MLAAVLLAGVVAVRTSFTGAVHGDMDTVRLINLIGFKALVSSGLIVTATDRSGPGRRGISRSGP